MYPWTLREYPCYGGLDLASVSDLTAFVLAWPIDQWTCIHPWFWIPAEGLAERARRDNVPYDRWAADGHIELTPGAVTDWRFVTERIKQLRREFDIQEIGFDRYGARDTIADLMDSGITVREIAQGPVSFNAPSRRLQQLVLSRQLIHSGHPVLRWNCDCTTVVPDANDNIKPVKPDRQRNTKRIDGMVAAIMAIDCAMRANTVEYISPTVRSVGTNASRTHQ